MVDIANFRENALKPLGM